MSQQPAISEEIPNWQLYALGGLLWVGLDMWASQLIYLAGVAVALWASRR